MVSWFNSQSMEEELMEEERVCQFGKHSQRTVTLKFFMTQKIRLWKFSTIGSCGIKTGFQKKPPTEESHQPTRSSINQWIINQLTGTMALLSYLFRRNRCT